MIINRILLYIAGGVGLVLLLALGVQTWRLEREQHAHERTTAAATLFAERVRSTAESLRARALARARAVEQRQQVISQEVSHAYEMRIADARRRAAALRLRAGEGRTNPGRGGDGLPSAAGTTGEPDGSAADSGLSLDERLIATEQAIRLEELQNYVRRMLEAWVVPPN